MATVEAGDEVIVPLPSWASYPDMVKFAGGTPVFIHCSQNAGFKMRPEELEAAITPKTKWVMFSSPNNPTGATYSREELKAISEVLLRHPHVWVISDDVYEHILFDDREFATLAQVEPRLYDRTLTVNSSSKAYSMTGFRLGWGGGMEFFGLDADLATFGKALGGGLPIGALSGRADIVSLLGRSWTDPKGVFSGGTFSGNPLSMAAGIATLGYMQANKATLYPYLNTQGARLAQAVNSFCEERQIGAQLLNAGSIFYMHFKRGISSSRDLADENKDAEREFYVNLTSKGVIVPGIHLFFISAAHTPQDIDTIATAFQDALLDTREDGFI
jgi:hypothetical protein